MIAIPLTLHFPPAVTIPDVVEVKRKRRGSRGRSLGTALVVGMILWGDDGQPCQVVSVNPDGVTGYCVPVENQK